MNVIWITADTFRKDHLGCYGNQAIHTPSLDALAGKSVQFNRHYAANFPSMPARADFYTGRWTACFMGWQPMDKEQVTLPQLLWKDFHTAAVVDTPFYVRGNMNYDTGFRSFIEVPGQLYSFQDMGIKNLNQISMSANDIRASWHNESDRFAPQTFTKAMQWLERHYKEDFFLYIDAWDPHEPWDAPSHYTELYYPGYDGEIVHPPYSYWQDASGFTEETVRKAHASYCGEITMVDTWVGYFLRHVENLDLMDTTAIIFTTDHGFYFGEHDGLFGKAFGGIGKIPNVKARWIDENEGWVWARTPLGEEIVALPLIIYVPGVNPGLYKGLTSAIDIMPTVLDIVGKDIPDVVEGKSLLPMMKDTSLKGREYVISTQPFSKPGQVTRQVDGRERKMMVESDTTVTTEEWSLLYSTKPGESWLYHLPSDPKQEKNVINEYPEIAGELHQMLVKFMYDYNLSPELIESRLELRL